MKILLIEESETCSECLLGIYNKRWFCLATNKDIDLLKSRYEKPSWCPLKQMPVHHYSASSDLYAKGHVNGWNDCIDVIMGETKC